MPTYDVKSWFEDPRSSIGFVVYKGISASSEHAAIKAARRMATDEGAIAMHKRGTARFQVVAVHN